MESVPVRGRWIDASTRQNKSGSLACSSIAAVPIFPHVISDVNFKGTFSKKFLLLRRCLNE